jgi:hypothetical protein
MSMRRTDANKIRRTISELLDQLYAVEHSMETFNRKADGAELERAAEHFNDMPPRRAPRTAHKLLPDREWTHTGNSGW